MDRRLQAVYNTIPRYTSLYNVYNIERRVKGRYLFLRVPSFPSIDRSSSYVIYIRVEM